VNGIRFPAVGALVAGLAIGGCRRPVSAPASRPASRPASQPARTDDPELPDDLDDEALVSRVLITDTRVADRHRTEAYQPDPHVAAGGVRGVCFVPYDKEVRFRTDLPVWPDGPNAITDPQEGEVAYFKGHPPRRYHPISAYDARRRRYGVGQAVLIFRGIARGRRPRLSRPSFIVNHVNGNLQVPQDGYNHGRGGICFAPRHERLLLANTEFFDCEIEVRRANAGGAEEIFFREAIPGYRDPKHPRKRYGEAFGMKPLKLVQTPALPAAGLYAITCRKHPWLKAHLWVVDNPYVCVSRADGSFEIDGIPEGAYDVDVWHPEYRPVKSRLKVSVEADKTAELPVTFATPALLTDPPRPTDTHIRTWACVGPFEHQPRAKKLPVYPPEERQDFDAVYEGKGAAEVRWRLAHAGRDGVLDLYALHGKKAAGAIWYLAAVVEAPRPQPITLIAGVSQERSKLWLNGRLLYVRPNRHQYSPATVMAELKRGRNVVLVKAITGGRNYDCRVAVAYKSSQVTVRAAGGEGLRGGYVWDPSAEAGALAGRCFVPFDKAVAMPRTVQVAELGIVDPVEGEAAHYRSQYRPSRPVLLGGFDAGSRSYPAQRAVLVVKDVRSGRRVPLKRARLRIDGRAGRFEVVPERGRRREAPGKSHVAFAPAGEPVEIEAADCFPYDLRLLDAAGKVACELALPAYADKYFPQRPYDPAQKGMARPPERLTPRLADPGRYLLTCRRHPWARGHLFVSRHPYLALSGDGGAYSISLLPPGRHTVEVWHPDFEPVRRRFEVDIVAGRTTKAPVAFKAPKLLSDPPVRTDRPIVEWVRAGPFPAGHDRPRPPEKALDFAATHAGRGKAKVSWRRVNASASGYLDVAKAVGPQDGPSTWYFAAWLEAARDVPVALGVGTSAMCRMFLNGRCIYDRPEHRPYVRDEDIVRGLLAAGRNALLVKLSWDPRRRKPPPMVVSVSFKADGVKAAAPEDEGLRPAYLRDERVATGGLKGVCFVPFAKAVRLPRSVPLALAGPHAVPEPRDGEMALLKRHPPSRPVRLGAYDAKAKRYPVRDAALVLRGVRSGKRYPLGAGGLDFSCDPVGFEVRYTFNRGRGAVEFSRAGRPVTIANGETFAHGVTVAAADGRKIADLSLPAYKDPRRPGMCYGEMKGLRPPDPVATPPLPPGRYALTCRRRPWRRGHVFALEHPYACLSGVGGAFAMDEVPVGTYTLEVWHPDFEPVRAAVPVEIAADGVAEVSVAFKPPALLSDPPPSATTPIRRWAALAPVGHGQKPDPPPEAKLDFKAGCKVGGKALAWTWLEADRPTLRPRQVGYYAANIEAPAAGRALLRFGADDRVTAWLNGELLYAGRGATVVARLRKGVNTLLARLSNQGGNGSLAVWYHAAGARADAPLLKPAPPAKK